MDARLRGVVSNGTLIREGKIPRMQRVSGEVLEEPPLTSEPNPLHLRKLVARRVPLPTIPWRRGQIAGKGSRYERSPRAFVSRADDNQESNSKVRREIHSRR